VTETTGPAAEAPILAEEADAAALLREVADVDGFRRACVVDPGSGTVLAVRPRTDDVDALAAGAADLFHVLTVMGAQSAIEGETEDLVVTTSDEQHLVRVLHRGAGESRLLVLTLDRRHSRLPLAWRSLRTAGAPDGD